MPVSVLIVALLLIPNYIDFGIVRTLMLEGTLWTEIFNRQMSEQ